MSFFWKTRLQAEPHRLVDYYYMEALKRPEFLEAIHWSDIAHLVMLLERDLIPPEVGHRLLTGLIEMEQEDVVAVRQGLDAAVHGGERYLNQRFGEDAAGWLHLGRSSPSIRAIAARLTQRARLLDVLHAVNTLRSALLDLAEQHVETVMPGTSYLQPIELTTLAHYLLFFVFPLARDVERLQLCYHHTNISAVGSEAAYGSQFDLDVARVSELLGFETIAFNMRDAIRQYDYLVEAFTVLALLHNTVGRLALDFVVWSSQEFDYVEIDSRYCMTSSISPQMRIPYMLEVVNGLGGLLVGRLSGALAINKTLSDQLEPASLLPIESWPAFDESLRCLELITGMIATVRVKADVMARAALASWAQASTLVGLLVRESGFSFRTCHQIVAIATRKLMAAGLPPTQLRAEHIDEAAREHLGRSLVVEEQRLAEAIDPLSCVARRRSPGGAAPDQVRQQLEQARATLEVDRGTVAAAADRVAAARAATNRAVRALTSNSSQSTC